MQEEEIGIILGFVIILIFVFMYFKQKHSEILKCSIISFRNIDVKLKYHMLHRYASLSKKEIKKSRCKDIPQAVNELVKKIEGGEFLKNATIYEVTIGFAFFKRVFYAAEGDVWGTK